MRPGRSAKRKMLTAHPRAPDWGVAEELSTTEPISEVRRFARGARFSDRRRSRPRWTDMHTGRRTTKPTSSTRMRGASAAGLAAGLAAGVWRRVPAPGSTPVPPGRPRRRLALHAPPQPRSCAQHLAVLSHGGSTSRACGAIFVETIRCPSMEEGASEMLRASCGRLRIRASKTLPRAPSARVHALQRTAWWGQAPAAQPTSALVEPPGAGSGGGLGRHPKPQRRRPGT